jgi:DNA-binding XRE family transcriptional regulator
MGSAPNKIKAFRNSLRLSQVNMGELLGVSDNYVYMLEKGERSPGKSPCLLMDRIKAERGSRVPGTSRRGRKGSENDYITRG